MYQILKHFEQKGLVVTELSHAFRINGVVDLFKKGKTVYNIKKNEYSTYQNNSELLNLSWDIINNTPRERAYKIAKNGITYQEFKHQKYLDKTIVPHFNAEDYHWNHNLDKTSEDHVYFLFQNGYVKIGRSKDIKSRMTAMKTGLPDNYEVYFIENKGFMERIFHNCFSDFRSKREWFRTDIRIKNFVSKHAKKFLGAQ